MLQLRAWKKYENTMMFFWFCAERALLTVPVKESKESLETHDLEDVKYFEDI